MDKSRHAPVIEWADGHPPTQPHTHAHTHAHTHHTHMNIDRHTHTDQDQRNDDPINLDDGGKWQMYNNAIGSPLAPSASSL